MATRAQASSSQRGFTLVELLVVISVIAILIGLILPLVIQARSTARVARGLSNMKQHAVATGAYSAANKGRLPHAPEGRSAKTSDPVGLRGRPALIFAARTFPTNGWAFPAGGGRSAGFISSFRNVNPTPSSGRAVVFDPNIDRSSMFDFYLPVLGPYLVGGEGMSMLSDVLISPGDSTIKRSWSRWRDIVRANDGAQPHPEREEMLDIQVGSYRYSPSLLVSPESQTVGAHPGGAMRSDRFTMLAASTRSPWPYQHLVYNYDAAASYPSRKVAFFLWHANHDRGAAYWVEDSADHIPVSLLDGSARTVNPVRDGFSGSASNFAGPILIFNTRRKGSIDPGFRDSTNPRMIINARCLHTLEAWDPLCRIIPGAGWPAHFYLTWAGIRGRDLHQ